MNTKRVSAKELIKLYAAFHPKQEFSNEDVFNWGIKNGHDVTPKFDRKAAALKKIKQAIKQSTVTDAQGRKVPRYIHVGNEEGSLSLWAELAFTPQPVVQRSVDMLSQKAVQNLVQAQTITDSYNDNYNLGSPVQLDLFSLQDAVAEGVILRRRSSGSSEEISMDEEDKDLPSDDDFEDDDGLN